VLATVVPGEDMALVTRQVLVGGTGSPGGPSSATSVGWRFHGVGLAAGLSALLASAAAYTAVKLAGAGYLLYCSDWSSGGVCSAASKKPPDP
jgi:threonine/homoserine/homoserine lactone efflux protein